MKAWYPAIVWLAGAAGFGPGLEVRSVTTGDGYELRISGRGRGWPEGAVVQIRFRRMVNRLEGPEGILATVPEETSWICRAVARQGAFAHREIFPVPGRVEVEAALDPAEPRGKGGRAEVEPVSGVFDVASPRETALVLRREVETWEGTLEEAGRFGEAGGRGRALRRLAALRRGEGRVLFSATAVLMGRVLEEYLNGVAAGRGKGGPHPGVLALPPADLPSVLHRVRDCFGRERRILVAEVAGRLPGADPASARRTLEVLRGSTSDDGALLEFLGEVEGDLAGADPSRPVQRIATFSDRARRGG